MPVVVVLDLEVDGEAVIGGMEAVPVAMGVIVAAILGTWLEIAARAVEGAEPVVVAVLLVVGMATWQGSALMGLAVVVEVAAAAAATSVVHLGIWRGTVLLVEAAAALVPVLVLAIAVGHMATWRGIAAAAAIAVLVEADDMDSALDQVVITVGKQGILLRSVLILLIPTLEENKRGERVIVNILFKNL